jgi:hypothetical protein
MPTLTFRVPNTEWAVLEEIAEHEGVDVRTLVLWKLKGEFGFPIRRTPPKAEQPAESAA